MGLFFVFLFYVFFLLYVDIDTKMINSILKDISIFVTIRLADQTTIDETQMFIFFSLWLNFPTFENEYFFTTRQLFENGSYFVESSVTAPTCRKIGLDLDRTDDVLF